MSKTILTFTKTLTDPVDNSDVRGTIRANEKAGYILTHAEAPERGEYLGNCECGMPVFEKDDYGYDHESGVYLCTECKDVNHV